MHVVTGSLWGRLLEFTSVLGTISLHPELSKILEMPAPWEIASLHPSPHLGYQASSTLGLC